MFVYLFSSTSEEQCLSLRFGAKGCTRRANITQRHKTNLPASLRRFMTERNFEARSSHIKILFSGSHSSFLMSSLSNTTLTTSVEWRISPLHTGKLQRNLRLANFSWLTLALLKANCNVSSLFL